MTQLRLADHSASWEVRRFDGLPFLMTEFGVFVEAAVKGVTLSQIHPVLDGRNRPILAPSAFDINTSLQRYLVKAIALHGLELYIYTGEDLPVGTDAQAANDAGVTVTRFWRAGSVDYKKVPQLQGVDLEPYRKKGPEEVRVTVAT